MDDQPGEKSEKRPPAGNQSRDAQEKTSGRNQKGSTKADPQGAMAGALAQALSSARKNGR
jgi:uncharacterized protein